MSKPKIIVFDLEIIPNLPMALKYWCKLSSFPGKTLKASVTTICCAGWKVLGGSKTNCINAWDWPKRWKKNVNDDYMVCKELRKVLENADAVITQNGIRFDWKYFQTRLVYHNLPPLPKIKHIDTKAIASSNLYFIDNKLETLGFIVGDKKMPHEGWDLWVDTHGRCPKAMKKMERYCKQDVKLLEKIYEKLKPLAKYVPNHDLYVPMDKRVDGKIVCPTCGSNNTFFNGWHYTSVSTYRRVRCKDCNAYSRLDSRDQKPRRFS
jgi:DNA polymerase elongation subunit (family B)